MLKIFGTAFFCKNIEFCCLSTRYVGLIASLITFLFMKGERKSVIYFAERITRFRY